MVEAGAIGDGRKVCTWSARKRFFFSHSARFIMSSSSCRMGGDEVRDQVLFLARLFRIPVEHLLELVIAAHAGFIILLRGPDSVCSGAT